MKSRWILAGVFGLAGLAAAGMVAVTWAEPDGGRWIFVAFAAFFGVLTNAALRPAPPPVPTSTQFVPVWFFDGAILVTAVLMLLLIASCIFGRK